MVGNGVGNAIFRAAGWSECTFILLLPSWTAWTILGLSFFPNDLA